MNGAISPLGFSAKPSEHARRKPLTGAFAAIMFFSVTALLIMDYLEPFIAENNHYILDYAEILERSLDGSWWYIVLRWVGDISEPQVMRMIPATVLTVTFAVIGYYFERKDLRFRGSNIVGGTGLFFPIMLMNAASILICNFVFYQDGQYGWMPTFAGMACVAPFMVSKYGYNIPKSITIVIITAFIPYIVARYTVFYVIDPLALPRSLAGWMGMAVGTIIAYEISRYLPWMTPLPHKQDHPSAPRKFLSDRQLFFERILADPSELVCWGSSWSSVGMYIGAIISWFLNPNSSSCPDGTLHLVIWTQVMVVAISNYFYFPSIKENITVFTFTGYVPIALLVMSFSFSATGLALCIIATAIICPQLTYWFCEKITLMKRWPLPVPILLSMGVYVVAAAFTIRLLN